MQGVVEWYSHFYKAKIQKLKIYTGVVAALTLEAVALVISAFYKSFRLRDGIAVAGFLTVIGGVISYALLSGGYSQKKWDEKNIDLGSTINQIKRAIQKSLPEPPSYSACEENAQLQKYGYSEIQIDGPYEWTQHMESRNWFFRTSGTPPTAWAPGNRDFRAYTI